MEMAAFWSVRRGKRSRQRSPDYVARGVFVDRVLGLVRAVNSQRRQIALRAVGSEEEIDVEANTLQQLLDEVDPIPHGASLPLPDVLPHLRLMR